MDPFLVLAVFSIIVVIVVFVVLYSNPPPGPPAPLKGESPNTYQTIYIGSSPSIAQEFKTSEETSKAWLAPPEQAIVSVYDSTGSLVTIPVSIDNCPQVAIDTSSVLSSSDITTYDGTLDTSEFGPSARLVNYNVESENPTSRAPIRSIYKVGDYFEVVTTEKVYQASHVVIDGVHLLHHPELPQSLGVSSLPVKMIMETGVSTDEVENTMKVTPYCEERAFRYVSPPTETGESVFVARKKNVSTLGIRYTSDVTGEINFNLTPVITLNSAITAIEDSVEAHQEVLDRAMVAYYNFNGDYVSETEIAGFVFETGVPFFHW